MSEQHGKVIDGTARASHWRRSSPSSTPDADASSGHSEAPKNIAFVAAGASAHAAGRHRSHRVPGPGQASARVLANIPPVSLHKLRAGRRISTSTSFSRRSVLRSLPIGPARLRFFGESKRSSDARPDALSAACRGSAESRRWWPIVKRTQTAARPITIAVATVGVLAALVVLSTVLGHSGAPERQSQSVGRANSLETLKPNVLTASADPFGTKLGGASIGHSCSSSPSRERTAPEEAFRRCAKVNSGAHEPQPACGDGALHADPRHAVTRPRDARYPKRLEHRIDPDRLDASGTNALTRARRTPAPVRAPARNPHRRRRSARWSQEPAPVAANSHAHQTSNGR